MASLNEFEKEFINKFEKAFIVDDNGKLDITKTSEMIEYYDTYGDMLCRRAHVKKVSFKNFSENDIYNQDIAKGIYFFGIDYYNILNDIKLSF